MRELVLFDVYRHKEQIGEGKKSYAVKFVFEDEEKTLTDVEVDAIMSKLIGHFERKIRAYIRS